MKKSKNNHPLTSLTFLSKSLSCKKNQINSFLGSSIVFRLVLIIIILLSVSAFSLRKDPHFVLINIESESLSSWKDRRLLADIINKVEASKPKAIVVTFPCVGFTSQGADRELSTSNSVARYPRRIGVPGDASLCHAGRVDRSVRHRR